MTERMTHRQVGPPLPAPALAALALTVASAAAFAGGPRPDSTPEAALDYLRSHQTRTHLLAFLVFAASIPVAVWSAAVYRRLRRLGVTAPGTAIALAGGVLASASLAASGLATWVGAETAPDVTAPMARVLVDLAFATGGPGFTAPLGLLLAGVAVPVLVLDLAPRWLGWTGLALAAVGVVSSATLLTSSLYPLLPITRFGGLLWMAAIGFLLPLSRRHRPCTDVHTDRPAEITSA